MAKKRIAKRAAARKLTAAEQQQVGKARQEAGEDKDYIRDQAKRWKQANRAGQAALRETFRLLKEERQRQSLSLADLEERTGMSRPSLSRLENDLESNPTITTLSRYAEALGKTLVPT
jgi:DNA-binding XRE family transcriptional regulator